MKAAIPLLTCLACACATPVAAHAILVDSSPAVRGTVSAGHQAVTLRFNSRIDRVRSRLSLIVPGKPETPLPIVGAGPADILTTAADLAPGAYTIRWQVLAVDGHITRGDLPFTVTPP